LARQLCAIDSRQQAAFKVM